MKRITKNDIRRIEMFIEDVTKERNELERRMSILLDYINRGRIPVCPNDQYELLLSQYCAMELYRDILNMRIEKHSEFYREQMKIFGGYQNEKFMV